jgi:hypothetical protein
MFNPFGHPRLLISTIWILQALVSTADTVAYYRFEDGTPGEPMGRSTDRSIRDSSGNGYHFHQSRNPTASADVPEPEIPRTGESNTRSLAFTGIEDCYGAPGNDLGRVVFTDFTLEVWVTFDSLENWQTIIGRDDHGPSSGEGAGEQSLFYLSKTTDVKPASGLTENGLRVELITRNNQILAINSTFKVVTKTWYHVAVVGDAKAGTLTLFVDGSEIKGTTGYTGLFIPAKNTAWTFGRGQYKGKVLDFLRGRLDEVRFSDQALHPRLFLNAPAPPPRPMPTKS